MRLTASFNYFLSACATYFSLPLCLTSHDLTFAGCDVCRGLRKIFHAHFFSLQTCSFCVCTNSFNVNINKKFSLHFTTDMICLTWLKSSSLAAPFASLSRNMMSSWYDITTMRLIQVSALGFLHTYHSHHNNVAAERKSQEKNWIK